jgi:hypothetical protein
MTGEAQQVRVEKRNVVHTTTRYESHATSNFDYMSGRFINGSVSVPVNDIHTKTKIESEFWLTDKDGKEEHFSFDHEIVPMKDGQRISVIWGALTGTERGKYKCIYNHATDAFTILPGRYYSDLGVREASFDMELGFFTISMFLVLMYIAYCVVNGPSHGDTLTWFFHISIPLILIYLWFKRMGRSMMKDKTVVKEKYKAIKKIIVEYAKTL